MAKTASPAPSASSSGDLHHKKPGPKPKYHLQSSSTPTSSTSSDSNLPLPQCKVKRNYACSKCPYYTQNPRSFLHHQKNVHAERLKVYECSHCLYASKHSQKLQRHVQMVHVTNKRGKNNREVDESGKQLLVPPVRIRVQRFEKFTDQHLAKLVIVEDVDVDEDTEVVTSIEDESSTEEHTVGAKEEIEEDGEHEFEAEAENEEDELDEEDGDGEEEEQDDEEEDDEPEDEADFSNDGSADADDSIQAVSLLQTVPSTQLSQAPPPSSQHQKKSYKQDKHPVTLIRCSVCPFGSHSRTLVNRHEKSAHLKKKFFRCMKCNYVTHMRARYTKHVKYHTMPMIKCEDCDFRTPYKWNLDRHNRNHSSIAPGTYKCSHCSFSADIKQSLTVHETNHHVPPVGGVFPSNGTNRRRYRVGASDAPGSAVDGTEIVTYETTKEGGIVEIMTETKSTSPTVTASSGGGSMSKVTVEKVGGTSSMCTVVKKTTTTTTTTTTSLPPAPIKVISVTSPPEGDILKAAEQKPRRRPMPQLIPIVDQQLHQLQQRRIPPIIRLRPPQENTAVSAAADDYYSLTPGQSALSDFASIIDDADCAAGPFNSTATGLTNVSSAGGVAITSGTATDRRPSSGSTSSSSTTSSPKSKTASFFDKLKAKVDETADLTCQVCRYESKCLSEFMRHQRTHSADPAANAAITATLDVLKTEDHTAVALRERSPTPLPPPPVTAAELKSTRCQRCRKRCKTSTELLVHLATCRGTTAVSAAVAAIDSSPDQSAVTPDVKETVNDEDNETEQHPMENKIFVWNTAAVTATPQGEDDENGDENEDDERDEQDSVTVTRVVMPPNVEPPSADREPDDESENDTNDTPDNNNPSDPDVLKHQEQLKHAIRKEGKMYKTVFKCPHCTFWAATASRFHVHIVGHLNRKPFECSCCAYRSNWRWDITKHIRLKSARKGGAEESVQAAANSHQGAKVLMTDETGRRNYSKYNRYLTVMEMDIADGADKAAGGECEDGKGVRKSVGGGIARKRRAPSFVHGNKSPNKQYPSQTSKAAAIAGQLKRFKAAAIRNQQLNQHMTHNNGAMSTPNPPSAAGGDNRSKTVWKCKKCFFRDCDRLTVLNHVKAHYRRGEFSGNSSATGINSSQHYDTATTATDTVNTAANNELYVQTTKSASIKETTEQNSPTTDRRKTKTPTTGTTSDTLLLLSTNPKSLMLYDDENFLSCPLCDVTAPSPGQLKEHMQSTHIPEETKYRCEYCPFWSEEKKAMLDHMMFAHEMDDGSVNTDVNATDANYGTEQRDESASNSINYDDEEEMQAVDENGSDDATANTILDNGSDDTNVTTNMEMLFDASDENIVVVETVECKPDFVDNSRGSTIETSSTPSKSSEKSNYSNTASDEKINDSLISSDYDGVEERDEDEQVEDEEIIVTSEEVTEPTSVKIIKATLAPIASAASKGSDITILSAKEIEVLECNECWYYSTNKRDLLAHKQLHVDRGALFHCTECVFNVTKSAILYHHYRHGHVIEEPELRFPEDSIVGAGQRDMNAKNSKNKLDNKTANSTDVDETAGPAMVWHYSKENIPPFTKVFKCRYCPHTNRRRHNTVDHERMHSDHPEHQNHRQMQQRLSGCSVPPSPLHPCKRCTYVCNNAGVLASHVKVHSTSYRCTTVGFYDTNSVDAGQMRALEYVMELERSLMLDKNTAINSCLSLSDNEVLSDSSSDNESPEDITKYTEIDEPELKFCPYCPARYFFRVDLQFHIRFHRYRGWKNSCDCCSFVARTRSQVEAHEAVHSDEYEQRTTELLASGYPVNPKYPRPSEYPVSVSDDLPPLQRRPGSPPQLLNYKPSKTHSTEPDSQRQRRTKRVRNSEPNVATIEQPPSTEFDDDHGKRRRRSMTVGVGMKSANAKPPPPALLPVSKTTSSKSPPPPLLPVPKAIKATEIKSTSSAAVKPDDHESTADATVKSVKPTKPSYIRQFMCTMCPGKFFKSTALQYHKTLHGGPGRYRCRCCDYAVSTYGNLVRHEAVHRDLPAREKVKTKTSKKLKALKKLKAKGKKIPLPVNLSTPTSDSQGQPSDATNDEDFQIDPEFGSIMLGNPSFYYPTTVKNGVIISKRYKCPKCPSAFDKRDQYAVHLTLHGAQDKYQCDKCDYAVRYTANYVQHQRKHARDAEIRKNHEQAADRAKMIKEQEEAANVQRIRKRPTAEDRKPQRAAKPVLPPVVKLQPQDTTFTNEISDQQTAYELNAAYGATGNLVGETTTSLFRCAHCPFECDIRSQLDRHTTHHYTAMNSSGAASKRSWKRSCRFCTYRTHGEVDLAEHTRVHFLRSTGEPVSNNEHYSTDETATVSTDVDDHVEFHGKRVVYSQRKRHNNDQVPVAENLDEKDIEPFFVFKDCGDFRYRTSEPVNGKTAAAIVRSRKRFSPDCPPPQMAIDYNDNRTGDAPKPPSAAFVRFFDSGTRLEFLDDAPVEPPAGKRRRSKK